MGYFSNGTEGEAYERIYCMRCVHGPKWSVEPCAVWGLQIKHNYDHCNSWNAYLDVLIPRKNGGVGNKQCSMFIEHKNAPDLRQEELL